MASENDRHQRYTRRAVLAATGALGLAGVTGIVAGAQTQQTPPNVAWTQEYLHESGEILAMHVAAASDGGYVLGGRAVSGGHRQFAITKTDPGGSRQWTTLVDDGIEHTTQEPRVVTQTADGGFVVAGYVAVPTEEYRPALLKTSSDGTRQWLQVLTEPKAIVGDTGYATVVQGADGGFTALARPWLVSYGAGGGDGGTATPRPTKPPTETPTTTRTKTRTKTPTATTTKKTGPGFGVLGAFSALGGLVGAGYAHRDESDD